MSKIKVLHVFQQMSRGGAETMIMNIYRKIDREKIQFDFLCMSPQKGDYDEEIKKLGGNIYIIPSPKELGRLICTETANPTITTIIVSAIYILNITFSLFFFFYE